MPRENASAKGRRLLVEGRVRILRVGVSTIVAQVQGDSAERYRCGFSPSYGWSCDCPARGRCSHLIALQLVTLRPRAQEAAA